MILLNSVQHPSEIYILIVLIMIPPTPLKKKMNMKLKINWKQRRQNYLNGSTKMT